MYEKQKVSCSGLLPNESKTNEHLKRSDLQALIWYTCLKQNIEYTYFHQRQRLETERHLVNMMHLHAIPNKPFSDEQQKKVNTR
jgi:hypothetical protein